VLTVYTYLSPNENSSETDDRLTPHKSAVNSRKRSSPNGSLSEYEQRAEVIFRIDPHGKFLRFNKDNHVVSHLMVNFSRAMAVYENRPDTFREFVQPHQTLTLTGTEKDILTLSRPRQKVLDFIEELALSVRYVPDWGWIYEEGMDWQEQEEMVDLYVSRVEWLFHQRDRLNIGNVEFIPLAKGLHRAHYELAADTYDQLGVDRIAVYVGQTRSLNKIIRRVEQAIEVFDPSGVLVIGRQAPNEVADLPQRVDGVAGLRNWKSACNLTADGYSSEALITWYNKVKNALQGGQAHRQIGLDFATAGRVSTDG